MGYYKNALICLNGHVISDNIGDHPELGEKFCQKCGAETIRKCLNCEADIRGEYYVESVICIGGERMKAPLYCHNCGKPFPWTEDELEAARMAIDEDDKLKSDEKELLKKSLPDLIAETPRTSLAVMRMKKAVLHVGSFTKDVLNKFIVSMCCELAKSQLGM